MTYYDQNSTTNSSSTFVDTDLKLAISPVFLIFATIISIYIIISNGFVIVFMCQLKYKKTRKRLSMILSLSFSDIITGISGLAVMIVRRCEETAPVSRYACAFVISLLEFGVTTSLFHTFCICLERFLAVRSKTFSKDVFGPTVRRNIFIVWIIFGLIIGFFKFVTPKGSICTLPNLYGEYYALFVRIEVFGLWLPFLVGTVTLYAITTFIIRSQMTKVHQAPFNVNLSIINNQNMNMYPDDNKQNTESRTTNDTNSRNAKNIENTESTTTNGTNSRNAKNIENAVSTTTNDINSRTAKNIENAVSTTTNDINSRNAKNIENAVSTTTNGTNSRNAKNIENAVSTTTNDINSRNAKNIENAVSTTTNGTNSRNAKNIENTESRTTNGTNSRTAKNIENAVSTTTNDINSRNAKNIENTEITTTNDTNSRTAQIIRNTDSRATNDIDSRHTIHIQTVTNRISPRHAAVVGKRQSNLNNITQRQNDYKTKAIKIVGIIVLVLVVTTGVGVLAMAVDAVCDWCVSDEIRHATTLLWVVNSAVNPVIYVCVIKEFRQAVIRAFKCR